MNIISILPKRCIKNLTSCAISIPFCFGLLSPSHSKPFSSQKPTKNNKSHKSPRIFLDLVTPKTNLTVSDRQTHLRLIQDILQSNSDQLSEKHNGSNINCSSSKEDPISMLFRHHREGLRSDPSVVSLVLSSCGCERSVSVGIQVHCLVIKIGFLGNVYVGSSLVSLYSKCSELSSAYQVFDEMPVRNVVSWTTIINGFAREWQVDACLVLYRWMRSSNTKPNDFTLTSLLSACTGSGCIGQGKSAHCQAIQMGFDSFIHVSNALISMYCKFGDVKEALWMFKSMHIKDLVTWNSMIAAYSQHGLALEAIDLFEQMKQKKTKPDAITFLGVLSSCRHAGLVQQGQFYFNSMAEYGLEPELDHYSCIVDLLGRAGDLEKARDFIGKMPISPNGIIWGSLLSSCRVHGNVWVGIEAAESRLALEPGCAATHLQLVNLYASCGCWDQAARVRKLMKDKGLKTDPGHSWIEIRNEVYRFKAEDSLNSRTDEITAVVNCLVDHMQNSGVSQVVDMEWLLDFLKGMVKPVLALVVLLSYLKKLGLEGDMVYSVFRSFLQLSVIGFVIQFIFNHDNATWIILAYLFMILIMPLVHRIMMKGRECISL
ncbi:pentatricopeptide repeat-containing protein At2g37320-like isoform X2 [Actinidia eriantha]|uniref:pentatricopeptide repeat-containing protein At2g37320-like isoform X2 n=1 Tax=Actinidia eriantha TaxID=165200 RepID=UPI002590D39A|nr:pentatricopeptide repeat-containing protein At2g37320-like isoform X2 [Actinidia eriantha]